MAMKPSCLRPSSPMIWGNMKTIVIANRKGGVGKTTVAYNLGAAYALAGRRVCFLDIDSQANLSTLCRVAPSGLESFKAAEIVNLSERLAIVPASKAFALLENEVNQLIDRNGYIRAKILPRLAAFDYCIIDTAPGLSILNVNALCAADMVHIIVNADSFSLAGLVEMREILDQVRTINTGLEYRIILNAAMKGRRLTDAALSALRSEAGYSGIEIPNRQHFADSNALRKPAIDAPDILGPFQKLAGEI